MSSTCNCKKRLCTQCKSCPHACRCENDGYLPESLSNEENPAERLPKRARVCRTLFSPGHSSPRPRSKRPKADSARRLLRSWGIHGRLKNIVPGPDDQEKDYGSLDSQVIENVNLILRSANKVLLSSLFSNPDTIAEFSKTSKDRGTSDLAKEIAKGIKKAKRQSHD